MYVGSVGFWGGFSWVGDFRCFGEEEREDIADFSCSAASRDFRCMPVKRGRVFTLLHMVD